MKQAYTKLNKLSVRYYEAIDHTFYGFICVITYAGCLENTRKACKSRAARLASDH